MKFRTGAVCMTHIPVEHKPLRGKYFTYLFEPHKYEGFGVNNLELIIDAENEEKAQQAYELFAAAITLVDGHLVFEISGLPPVLSYSLQELKSPERFYYKNVTQFSRPGIYKAATLASRASFRRRHTNSLYKYLLACNHHSNYIIHLDPSHTEYQKLSRNPLDHLRYAHAILTLYSIIEELGLEIRSTQSNPSKINGEWNPKVKTNLEERLKKAGVKLANKALWNLRSRPTRVHLKDKLKLAGKANWARYSVRDSEIEIIDAIAYSSWLRSKVTAHKLNDSFLSISIYDVANVNFLVRQILLDVLRDKGNIDY